MHTTRTSRLLALIGALAFFLALVPSHSDAGTIPTPTGTGAVCVVSGKVQPTACSLAASPPTGTGFRHVTSGVEDGASSNVALASQVTGLLPIANGGTGAGMTCADGDLVTSTSSSALACHAYVRFGTAALTSATGLVRLPAEPGAVIAGLSGASDYNFLAYSAGGASWTIGNTSQYSYLNGFGLLLTSQSVPGTYTDGPSSIVTDLTTQSTALNANFTTTSQTAVTIGYAVTATAGEKWELEYFGTVQQSAVGGMKYSIIAPATCTVEGWLESSTTAITTPSLQRFTAINTLTSTATHTVATTPGPDRVRVRINAVAGGTLAIGVASVTAATTTTVFAGSYFRARRVTGI